MIVAFLGAPPFTAPAFLRRTLKLVTRLPAAGLPAFLVMT
jgi:hypothetical protein